MWRLYQIIYGLILWNQIVTYITRIGEWELNGFIVWSWWILIKDFKFFISESFWATSFRLSCVSCFFELCDWVNIHFIYHLLHSIFIALPIQIIPSDGLKTCNYSSLLTWSRRQLLWCWMETLKTLRIWVQLMLILSSQIWWRHHS